MPGIRHRLRLDLLALLIAAITPAVDAQRGARSTSTGGSSGTTPISASVMTTYLTSSEDGVESVAALVIWRGEPGWIAVGDSSGSSGSSSRQVRSHRFSQGGYEFEVVLDHGARTLQVLNRTIDLRKGNVVFVDHIGSAQGPRIVRTLLIDGTLAATPDRSPVRIVDVMARSPEIRDYLRCDVPLSNAALQKRLAPVCDRILGR